MPGLQSRIASQCRGALAAAAFRFSLLGTPSARACAAVSPSAAFFFLLLAALAWPLANAQPLVIATSRTTLSLPVLVADARGLFAAEGVQVALRDCIGGHRCLRLMLDGQADLATATELPVMFNSFQRSDFALLATFAYSHSDNKLVVNAGIESPMQLTGRRVGVVLGTSSQFSLDLLLLYHGVDAAQLTIVPLAPEQMEGAARERSVDALVVWEPFATHALAAFGAGARALPNLNLYTTTFNLIARRALVGARDADLTRVLRALAAADALIREQPALARRIAAERLQLDGPLLDRALGDLAFRLALDQTLVTTLDSQARWALRAGHVPRTAARPNYLHFIHAGPLRALRPDAVTLVN